MTRTTLGSNLTPHTPLFGETGGQHPLATFIDHTETYGPHVIKKFAMSINDIQTVVDLGAGSGRDLEIIKAAHPTAKCIAIEGGRGNTRLVFMKK